MPEETLLAKIKAEVGITGFPLELRISQLLQDAGYYVANNLYYLDKDEGKGREIDLRALKNHECKYRGKVLRRIRHCFFLECKKSSKPWVILTSPETPYDLSIDELHCAGMEYPGKTEDLDELLQIHPFWKHERRGRSYFVAFTKGSGNDIYGALTNAVKAAIAGMEESFGADANSLCFYYPLVVFDGSLFEAYLSSGEIKVNEVNSVMAAFFYQSQRYEKGTFIVPIFTERAFQDFLSTMDKVLSFMGTLVQEDLESLLAI